MNPTENEPLSGNGQQPEAAAPIVGYCRATGKALTAEDATYVGGILYSKEYAEKTRLTQEPLSPYTAPVMGNPKNDISPGWAFVLGLIPGVGAIYNQQYAKGLFHIVVFASLISLLDRAGNGHVLLSLLLAGWVFYMPFEAYHTAQKRQNGEVVDEMTGLVNLPQGLRKLPIGPFVLIAFGFLFLLDNLGLLRIDELMRFWPVILIAIGVLLLMQRMQEAEAIASSPKEQRHAE
ncbi:LiaI-LiaF-like domain-containing protein [Bryobacter aggregatus]|uniref:LiaI-LiaF-like domain-containing protein n=1 Tax=Bryobacter aggregatus TaxID=360054 RepID=UPI0004E27BFA|nr:DUF5668 domain-containing protein [Bryobacter aggregatus]